MSDTIASAEAVRQILSYALRTGYSVQSGEGTSAPSVVWADADFEVGDGTCGLHADQKPANEPAIPYVRIDALIAIRAQLVAAQAQVQTARERETPLSEDARVMQKRIGSTPFPEGFQQIADDAHVMIARQAFRVADLEKRIAAMQPSVADAAKVLLDLLETPSEIAPISGDKIEHVWHETFRQSGFCAVSGFLRTLSNEPTDS